MSVTLFDNKKNIHTRKVKRNDVRKPNIDPSKIGDVINKPKHLGIKKTLLEEKKGLLEQKKAKKRRGL